MLRTNLTEDDPAKLWEFYLQLVEVEAAFKTLKGDLAIRPVFHQIEPRIEAHIFIAPHGHSHPVPGITLLVRRAKSVARTRELAPTGGNERVICELRAERS